MNRRYAYVCTWLALISGTWLFAASPSTCAQAPMHVYLTWQGDTSSTMTVNFQTEAPIGEAAVYFDTESHNGIRSRYAYGATGESRPFPGLRNPRYVHTVELTGLRPGTAYYFVAGDAHGDVHRELKFRTIPEGDEPIRFVTGGDMDVVRRVDTLLAESAKLDPMFAVIGGDIAYVNGDLRAYRKWDIWLNKWHEHMVTPDGFMIPMVHAIGNHEVDGAYNQPPEKAPFYFGYFAQGGRSYFSRQFGANVAMIILDTEHIVPHEDQVDWLEEQLARYQDVEHLMAVYHVPLYPSHRDFMGGSMVAGRTHWAPLFDEYGLDVAFENHDHTVKRTARIKGNRIDPRGTLYLGDGCFGKDPRDVDAERRWYEEFAASIPHFWFVEAGPERVNFRAIDADGEVVDETTLP